MKKNISANTPNPLDLAINAKIDGFLPLAAIADANLRKAIASVGFARNIADHPDMAKLRGFTKTSDRRFARSIGLSPEEAERYAVVMAFATLF